MATTPSTIPAAYRLTYRDWLQFPEDGRLYEIIGGELFVSPTPGIRHQRVSRRLLVALDAHLRAGRSGEVFHPPTGVRLSDEDVPEPDLVVVLAMHADRIGEQVIEGPPDLVVEILSPGTAGRDLVIKRALYARAGIVEYWIADPAAAQIEVLTLEAGRYATLARFTATETLASRLLPDLRIPLERVFTERPTA
ncbi:MAG: Uma2 family endonuclease [Gemmatimonadetes bacterium]|nr:Uma2 family endonuclease [Gemmatimonadota bacterium]